MAKNILSNTSYRNLDVDIFDVDRFVDGEEADTPGLGPDEQQVKQLLQSNKNVDALKAALANPPLKTKNQAIKDKTTGIVTKVLTSFKSSEIEAAVNTLSSDEIDLLMKYVYKGMELLADGQTSTSLLAWHAHLFSSCGHGGIVRVFCDRNRL
ncbi:ARP2/3 complex 16 kDa subunit (p16-Arc) domain-containing protein [Ditylenchus destructor]|uniref:Actin-related protein 2/3 complex subunit 5 n=1 Tax=Ditylenchus destructor TaxID=166010 RepID=A0AAD4N398_9BILA|nr:ARP2/3 complex 16 kDa subunit (p16-Arc) domain-containing protein [Ditylenchus destructor]